MLKKGIKVLFLLSGALLISACDNKGSQQQTGKKAQSKSSEKSVLIECKSTQNEGSKFFNSTIEIFSMTDEVLDKVHKLETQGDFTKSDLPIYARVKNIELIDKKSSIKDSCINTIPFYGKVPFEKLSAEEFKLMPSIESCKYAFFVTLDMGGDKTLLQRYKNDIPNGAPFVSDCRMVK